MSRGAGRRSGTRAVALTLTLVLASAACASGGDGARSVDPSVDDAGTPGLRLDALERDGDGWAVPDPLPAGDPGQVIAVGEPSPSEELDGATRTDLLYHSTDRTGADRPVSGTLLVPAGDPPEGGWPVLSWAHGTSGVADACAPSTHANLFVGNPDLEPNDGPLLVVQGSEDQDIPQLLTDDLVASLEAQDVDVTYRLYPGEGHDTVLGPTVCETLTWLAGHGGPSPTACEPAPTDLS